MSNTILVETKNKIQTITINRPDSLNALNVEVLSELVEAFNALSSNSDLHKDIHLVLLRGAGDKAFVAGADIKHMQQADQNKRVEFADLGQGLMCGIEELPVPVVAVVDGFALGGGLELALACDLIVASTKAKLGQPEVALGLIPGFGGTQRLIYRAGVSTAKRLIFSGEHLSADEALRLGIVDYVFSEEELEVKLQEIVNNISKQAPLALAAAKRAINFAQKDSLSHGLKNEVAEFIALFNTKDTEEGLAAFMERRKAEFIGI